MAAERLPRYDVPDGEQTCRVVFPDGRSFRVGIRDDGGVRFAIERANVQMTEFYGRSRPGADSIVGLKFLPAADEQGGGIRRLIGDDVQPHPRRIRFSG